MAEYSPITPSAGWHVGDDNPGDWIIYDDGGVVVDITGWTVEWVLRSDKASPDNILRYTTADAELDIPTGIDGKISLDVPDTDTDGKQSGNYYYWLRRTDGGSEKTIAEGPVALQRSTGG